MKQLSQKLKNGQMGILEVPIPQIKKEYLKVQNYYSLISIGTESSTVKAARKGYIGKALERPQQVKQVIETFKAQGLTQTYRAVMKKIDAFSPLGYSCVGKIIDINTNSNEFRVGDFVACGGLSACHSEIVCVPTNLCVKLMPDTDFKQAAYNTLGAIAMQGIRQANLKIGENCAVIGLGLLGQITGKILRASGINVIGIDIKESMVNFAGKHSVDLALTRNDKGILDKIFQFTDAIGCDAVIITAATTSHDPINFAGEITRKRGTIVIVGNVPTGFDREPHYYKKELTLKMSCSYGPGRYDPSYEEKGIDYPVAYVRWTEKRNMLAFQELIYKKRIELSHLTTHEFTIDDATSAYDLINNSDEDVIGILIKYDFKKEIVDQPIQLSSNLKPGPVSHPDKDHKISIGFIGAGSYAQNHLLPNLIHDSRVNLDCVVTASGTSAYSAGSKYKFNRCSTSASDIYIDQNIDAVFIATRHDSHAKYAAESLKNKKHVFVEKPLCLNMDEFMAIKSQIDDVDRKQLLMVGYNRRFSPLSCEIKSLLDDSPKTMIYRINAGNIPSDSWYQDKEAGGGRIIGEICHFIDLLTYFNESSPDSVYATVMKDKSNLTDTLNISLTYPNGSIGYIGYFSNGDKCAGKEYIEIYSHGNTIILDDFKKLKIYTNGKLTKKNCFRQDKGQKEQLRQFISCIIENRNELIPYNDMLSTSLTTFKIIESINQMERIKISSIN